VITADVAPSVLGHHATNHPFPVVVWTCSPSLRTMVTPVIPVATADADG